MAANLCFVGPLSDTFRLEPPPRHFSTELFLAHSDTSCFDERLVQSSCRDDIARAQFAASVKKLTYVVAFDLILSGSSFYDVRFLHPVLLPFKTTFDDPIEDA